MKAGGTLRLGLIGAATLASLAIPSTATASFPGTNGKLAFGAFVPSDEPVGQCGPGPGCDAYVTHYGLRLGLFDPGTRKSVLLPTCVQDCAHTNPNWSPDGRRLVFAQAQANTLMTAAADGSDVRLLTAGRHAAWSPDGRQLVVEDRPANRSRPELYVINADGTGRRQLTFANGSEPAWSLTNRIVFRRYNQRYTRNELRLIRPSGGGTRLIARDAETPDWSPRGDRVVYRSGSGGIWVVRTNGSKRRRLTRSGIEPVWSPDGRQIAYTEPGRLLAVSAVARRPRARVLRGGLVTVPAWQPQPR